MSPKYPGAKFVHGHHLKLKEYQRKPYPAILNICKFCSKQFISKKHHRLEATYCSRECTINARRNGDDLICVYCKSIFHVALNIIKRENRKYCSRSCRSAGEKKDSVERGAPGHYLKNAYRVYEKKCYDCGLLDERVIVVHHIDGNRKNGAISNLIPVCHNCHCIRHIELSGNNRLPSFRR
jgi:hypothetical protein